MTVKIICWDGVEYERETTPEEIEEACKCGYLTGTKDNPVFDHR